MLGTQGNPRGGRSEAENQPETQGSMTRRRRGHWHDSHAPQARPGGPGPAEWEAASGKRGRVSAGPRGDENGRLMDTAWGCYSRRCKLRGILEDRVIPEQERERNSGGPPAEQSGRCGETAQGAAATRETRSRIKRGVGAECVGCSDLTLNMLVAPYAEYVGCSLR
jgi:hypothetical protein